MRWWVLAGGGFWASAGVLASLGLAWRGLAMCGGGDLILGFSWGCLVGVGGFAGGFWGLIWI